MTEAGFVYSAELTSEVTAPPFLILRNGWIIGPPQEGAGFCTWPSRMKHGVRKCWRLKLFWKAPHFEIFQ